MRRLSLQVCCSYQLLVSIILAFALGPPCILESHYEFDMDPILATEQSGGGGKQPGSIEQAREMSKRHCPGSTVLGAAIELVM